jgi:predicted ATP-grasp superfamily ATP-dependent carboligase
MAEPGGTAVAGRAILTYARGWQALVATRSLGQRGVEVVTGDEYGLTPASLSRYSVAHFQYPSPSAHPEGFLAKLEAVVQAHRPADPSTPYVLVPIHAETYLIARHRERFEPHIRLPIPDAAQIDRVNDKGALAAYAMERGLPIPRTWLPRERADLERWRDEISLPAFVKLRAAAAGVGIQKVHSAQELLRTFDHFVEHFGLRGTESLPLVQAAVPGDDYCVTALFERGRSVARMTYHNLRSFPAERGAGVLRETVEAPAMERVAAAVLEPLGWHGVAELDFRWDGQPDHPLWLIEVNPRFWGGLNQAVASGWDYPWLLFQLGARGHVEVEGPGQLGVRTETPILGLLATLEEIAHRDDHMAKLRAAWHAARADFHEGARRAGLHEILAGLRAFPDARGRVRAARELLEIHHHNVFDVLSRDDPWPALGVLFPLAVFLRHGRVDLELLVSEGGPSPGAAS